MNPPRSAHSLRIVSAEISGEDENGIDHEGTGAVVRPNLKTYFTVIPDYEAPLHRKPFVADSLVKLGRLKPKTTAVLGKKQLATGPERQIVLRPRSEARLLKGPAEGATSKSYPKRPCFP